MAALCFRRKNIEKYLNDEIHSNNIMNLRDFMFFLFVKMNVQDLHILYSLFFLNTLSLKLFVHMCGY